MANIDNMLIDAINERIGMGWSIESLGARLQCLSHINSASDKQCFLDGQFLLAVRVTPDGIEVIQDKKTPPAD